MESALPLTSFLDPDVTGRRPGAFGVLHLWAAACMIRDRPFVALAAADGHHLCGRPGHTRAVERHDFGVAVRHLRENTDPAAVGLPVGGRRVPGLRREELGELAGMSADYVRRLEQGRSHPSAGVVNAIARALGAGRADYERLSALAGYAAADGQVPTDLGPGATRLLERFSDTPMIVTDAAMNLVAVNSAFMALEHWDLTGERWEWNVAWRIFCSPFAAFQQSTADATSHETIQVAQLRAALLQYPGDASLATLVDEMQIGRAHV